MSEAAELLLLGLLDERHMHGYQLHEFLEHKLRFVSDLKRPTAYRLLERLYAQGLVTRDVERAGRRPERQVYRLTAAGHARLQQLLRAQLASADHVLYPGNVAVLFWDRLAPAERQALLRRRREAVLALRAELAAVAAAHTPGSAPRVVLEHDLAHADVEVAWLDQTIASLVEAAAGPAGPAAEVEAPATRRTLLHTSGHTRDANEDLEGSN